MKKYISIDEISQEFHTIELQNDKKAILYECMETIVKDVNPKEDTRVYKYYVPCPLCDTGNRAYSYDGRFFGNIQLNCSHCGIYYRAVVKRGN
ncbi:hypothetical protein D3C71_1405810 [compost metagenome]